MRQDPFEESVLRAVSTSRLGAWCQLPTLLVLPLLASSTMGSPSGALNASGAGLLDAPRWSLPTARRVGKCCVAFDPLAEAT